MTEAPLVRAVESFEQFYRREFPRMVMLALAVSGSRLAAEDIAQESMIEASRRWDVVGGYDKPGAWVRRVTIRNAGKRLRRARTELRILAGLVDRSEVPLGGGEEREVMSAVRSLPLRQRAAISLHYLEGYSVGEVAEVLGCAEGTVKAHLFRARNALAVRLGEEVSE